MRRLVAIICVLLLAGFLPSSFISPAHAATGTDRLNPGERLYSSSNGWLRSPNGKFQLIMQGDGNLVIYMEGRYPVWYTNTTCCPGDFLIMQGDGNLVLYASNGQTSLGSTGTANQLPSNTRGWNGAYLKMQDDGNLVVYATNGTAKWASGTQHLTNQHAGSNKITMLDYNGITEDELFVHSNWESSGSGPYFSYGYVAFQGTVDGWATACGPGNFCTDNVKFMPNGPCALQAPVDYWTYGWGGGRCAFYNEAVPSQQWTLYSAVRGGANAQSTYECYYSGTVPLHTTVNCTPHQDY